MKLRVLLAIVLIFTSVLPGSMDVLRYASAETSVKVDRTVLKAKIHQAKSITEALYVKETVETLKIKLKEAIEVNKNEKATQEEIDTAVKNLDAAINGLIGIKADKSALVEKIAAAQSITSEVYTKESWEKLQIKITKAIEVNGDENATQKEVDKALENLEAAITELKVFVADKSVLAEKIAAAQSITSEVYTKESWEKLQIKITKAIEVNGDEKAKQKEVDEALENLEAAITDLKVSVADKTVLAEKIAAAQSITGEVYAKESWDRLQIKITKAIEVNGYAKATQKEVDTALENLEAAITDLKVLTVDKAVLQKKKGKGGGGGGAGAVLADNTKTDKKTDTKADEKAVTVISEEIPLSPKIALSENKVIATFEMNNINKSLDAAKTDDGIKIVTARIDKVENANVYSHQIPVRALSEQALKQKIQVITPLAEITLPGNMLDNMKNSFGEMIDIEVSVVDSALLKDDTKKQIGNRPVIELNAKDREKSISWNNPKAKVKVAIDYAPSEDELNSPENIVVCSIDNQGKITLVPNGRYDEATGKVIFNTNCFGKYAITFVKKTFRDLESIGWASKQIEVLAAKGIINGTSETTFDPSRNIKRADFICLLVKALDLTAESDSNFNDVESHKYYFEAVGIAKKLGMTKGIGKNLFKPEEEITRQDMMVLVVKGLELAGDKIAAGEASDIEKFTDAMDVAGYAVNSVATLVKGGVVKGSGGILNPKGRTTRAEVASILYSLYNK